MAEHLETVLNSYSEERTSDGGEAAQTARVAGERATPTAALDVLRTVQTQLKRSQARGEQASLFPVSMK